MNESSVCAWVPSPIGAMRLVVTDGRVAALQLPSSGSEEPEARRVAPAFACALIERATRQLDDYFAGRRERFELPLGAPGTAFQKRVWAALEEIPFGETRSYFDVAVRLGKPTATRAVGAANGKNPIAIVVPCHRVIGKNGTLTGYAGGLAIKEMLLRFEREGRGGVTWSGESPQAQTEADVVHRGQLRLRGGSFDAGVR
jgi:methylated-DNA-[protein]-cysteine S-methyltransferase